MKGEVVFRMIPLHMISCLGITMVPATPTIEIARTLTQGGHYPGNQGKVKESEKELNQEKVRKLQESQGKVRDTVEGKQYGGEHSVQRRHTIGTVDGIQYGCVTPSVQRRHIICTVEGVQVGGGYAVRTCHTTSTDRYVISSVKWRVCRTCHIFSMVEGVQYGSVTSSVWTKVCETGLLKLLRGVVGVCIYLEKMIFYRQSYYNLDFIPLWLYPDIVEIPSHPFSI